MSVPTNLQIHCEMCDFTDFITFREPCNDSCSVSCAKRQLLAAKREFSYAVAALRELKVMKLVDKGSFLVKREFYPICQTPQISRENVRCVILDIKESHRDSLLAQGTDLKGVPAFQRLKRVFPICQPPQIL